MRTVASTNLLPEELNSWMIFRSIAKASPSAFKLSKLLTEEKQHLTLTQLQRIS
jgi:hypothetical protein